MSTATLRSWGALVVIALLGVATTYAGGKPDAPKIVSITSPAHGIIVIKLEQLKPFDNGYTTNAFPSFAFYRANGQRQNEDGFEQFSPHTDPADTVNMTGYVTGIRISGLRNGEQSFYVRLSYYVKGEGVVYSDPSNIVAVNVTGNNTTDGDMVYSITRSEEAGVAEAFERGLFAAYPNPTAGIVQVPAPEHTGDAAVALYDAHGVQAMTATATVADGRCVLATAGLPTGLYFAIVRQGLRSVRSEFTVVR